MKDVVANRNVELGDQERLELQGAGTLKDPYSAGLPSPEQLPSTPSRDASQATGAPPRGSQHDSPIPAHRQ